MNLATKAIAAITAALVLALAVAAFVLSFDALRALAQEHGLSEQLSFLFPLVVDGFIVVSTLSVVRANLLSEMTWFPWLLTFIFVGLSTWFNIEHGDVKNTLSGVIRAVPPVALFLSFELLMSQVRGLVRRLDMTLSLRQMQERFVAQRDKIQAEIDKLTEKRDRVLSLSRQARDRHKNLLAELRQERDKIRAEIVRLSKERDDLSAGGDRRQSRIDIRRQAVAEMARGGCEVSEIATSVNVSERTVYRDLDALGIEVGASENGNK